MNRHDTRPQNYTAATTVARDETIRFAPTRAAARRGGWNSKTTRLQRVDRVERHPPLVKFVTDVSKDMAVGQSDTTTVSLAAVGAAFPHSATVDVTIVRPDVLEVQRRDERFVLECDGDGWTLTGVIGREELPERVPDWLEPVAAQFGIDEVAL